MCNTATFTFHIKNIVKNATDQIGCVLRVFQSLKRFLLLSLLKSFLIPSLIRKLLSALESMEGKWYTSYRRYSTNVYKQNHWSATLKLLGKTEQTQIILNPDTTRTLYNCIYIYLKDNTTYGAKYGWYNGAQNKTRSNPRHGTQCVIEYPTNKHPAQSPPENAVTVGSLLYNLLPEYLREIYNLNQKNSNLSSTNFINSFLMSPKCPTVSPQQKATTSRISSLIVGFKQSTTPVESSTRPRTGLRIFHLSKMLWGFKAYKSWLMEKFAFFFVFIKLKCYWRKKTKLMYC